MNYLAIDYGKKRIGLAWMQVGLGVVLPYGVITHDGKALVPAELVQKIKDERIDHCIIGLPLGMEGEENENTKRIREFAHELSGQTGIPHTLFDERFTSLQSDAMGGDVSRDEKSAMIILEDYKTKHSV